MHGFSVSVGFLFFINCYLAVLACDTAERYPTLTSVRLDEGLVVEDVGHKNIVTDIDRRLVCSRGRIMCKCDSIDRANFQADAGRWLDWSIFACRINRADVRRQF